MEILHFRVDDRLIHGQVLIGWGSKYKYNAYIICDEELAVSDWEKEMYLAAVPPTDMGEVLAPGDIESYLNNNEFDSVLILIRSLQQLENLVDSGFNISVPVILGGLHDRPERKRYYDYLYLSEGEIEILKNLSNRGFKFICQDLPDHPTHDLSAIL